MKHYILFTEKELAELSEGREIEHRTSDGDHLYFMSLEHFVQPIEMERKLKKKIHKENKKSFLYIFKEKLDTIVVVGVVLAKDVKEATSLIQKRYIFDSFDELDTWCIKELIFDSDNMHDARFYGSITEYLI